MDIADLIGVHETRIAHHIAAIREIDREHRAAAMLDGRYAVIVEFWCDRLEIPSRKQILNARQELGVD